MQLGTIARASNSISVSVSGIMNMPGAAFSIAATTVVGQAMGKGKTEEAEESLSYLTKFTMVTSAMGMWILRISLGYILAIPMKFGLLGVWMAMYIDWVVRGLMYYVRLKKGKWKEKVVISAS